MDGIIDQVRRMPLAEKRRLAEALRQAIAEELASGGGEPDRCPRCGCPAFVRKGRDAAGRQRWLCRGCGQTFGAGTLGLLVRSGAKSVSQSQPIQRLKNWRLVDWISKKLARGDET